MFNSIPAIRSAGGAVIADKWFSNGQEDMVTFFGAQADELYLTGTPASGNITGSFASNLLSVAAAPTYRQTLVGGDDDPLGAGFVLGADNRFFGDYHNVTTGSLAILTVWLPLVVSGGGSRGIISRRAAPDDGYVFWQLDSPNRGAFFIRGSGGDASFTWPLTIGTVNYVFMYRNGTNIGGIGSEFSDVSAADNAGDLSSVGPFSMGNDANFYDSAGGVLGPTVIWTGANADTVIASRTTTMPAWWAA